ncbi:hypothetical protein AVEN_37695-1 [Araneus ventricosus]|uniref:Uncharacterized protein n=1 Tax=Araneus ventricosus TaxID=182803 RepID=A0A4Y2WE58_ARAVE|nr:hypothetical protein AVEN_37695-1 [Araneus ventricosus]
METFVTTLYPCRREGFQSLSDKLPLLSANSSQGSISTKNADTEKEENGIPSPQFVSAPLPTRTWGNLRSEIAPAEMEVASTTTLQMEATTTPPPLDGQTVREAKTNGERKLTLRASTADFSVDNSLTGFSFGVVEGRFLWRWRGGSSVRVFSLHSS